MIMKTTNELITERIIEKLTAVQNIDEILKDPGLSKKMAIYLEKKRDLQIALITELEEIRDTVDEI